MNRFDFVHGTKTDMLARLILTFSAILAVATGCGGGEADATGIDAGTDSAIVEHSDASVAPPVLGGGSACDLLAIARQIAESENDVPPVDCGTAVMADPESRWTAFSNCLSDNLLAERAFYGAYELNNSIDPDSVRAFAYVGIVGPPFVLKQVLYDSDPSGGVPGTPPRSQLHQCVDYGVRENCEATPGWVCMGCFDQTRPALMDLCPGWSQP